MAGATLANVFGGWEVAGGMLANVIGGWEAAGGMLADGIATWPVGTSIAGGMNVVFEGPVSGPQKDRNWTGPRPQSGLFFGPVFDI